ncbi:glycine zipper domain-containing protein [Escherichia coli]|uniref:glycine zipper domain-containing protein n=1 Tax=Escherichia coli TaxID=562 RepID=UPI0002A2CA89|nr:DUF883 family protein [Escherichia coli]ELC26914.1 hypothetical protein WCY_03342 [Escherichia coli KTE16]MPQ92132.1 DUF883 family protein [Escherichia coli]WKR73223.1 DUF883 family protein [Escherichia coli]HBN2438593.1 DUF883 family protein [Escherichia coli]
MFEKVEDKAKEVAGEVQEKYGELTDDCGHQIKGAACKIAARGSLVAQEAADVVRNNVENNTFAAISIGAGVGLLIGLLIGRK